MTTEIILADDSQFTGAEVKAFEDKYMTAMHNLSGLLKQQKQMEADIKKIKGSFEKVMDEYGIKSLDNDFLKVTRVAGTSDSVTLDLDKFQKEEPDLYKELMGDYKKTVKGRKGSIRFGVK